MEKKLKILTLFVQHGVDNHPTAIPRLKLFFERFSQVAEFELCIIENQEDSMSSDHIQKKDHLLLRGDNSFFEFSGWDKAISHYGPALQKYDFVHFVTSAFNLMYSGYLDHFDESQFTKAVGEKVSLGHVDIFPKECALFGKTFRTWIRSCFFFIPPSVVTSVTPLASIKALPEIFTGDPEHPLKNGAMSPVYQNYLVNWLTGKDVTEQWHSTFKLNHSTYGRFVNKMTAILNEHSLTMRLKEVGFKILDVGYSFTLRHRLDYKNLPDLETQVLTRKSIVNDPTYFL